MSDSFVVLIPADPEARPTAERLKLLEAEHGRICATDECRLKDYGDRIQFIEAGENFEAVACPSCGADMTLDWWGHRMDHGWTDESGFHLCEFRMPCCGAGARLDTLDYRPHQGFATWFVSARNPDRPPLNDGELRRLEAIAGVSLRAVHQRY